MTTLLATIMALNARVIRKCVGDTRSATNPPGTDKNDANGKIRGKKEAALAIRVENTTRLIFDICLFNSVLPQAVVSGVTGNLRSGNFRFSLG